MSNSVSKFIINNDSSVYNDYFIIAKAAHYSVHISFNELSLPTCVSVFAHGEWFDVDLNKDQITYFLSLDCPDAFIAYALTLCPRPPETSEHIPDTDKAEVDGGILVLHALLSETVPVRSYTKTDYPRYGSVPVNGCSQPFSLE